MNSLLRLILESLQMQADQEIFLPKVNGRLFDYNGIIPKGKIIWSYFYH